MIEAIEQKLAFLHENGATLKDLKDIYYVFKSIKELEEQFKEIVLVTVEKYSSDELLNNGIEKRSGKRTYSFDHIPAWVEKKCELQTIETLAKSAISASFENDTFDCIDQSTGEIIEKKAIIPARVKTSSDIVIFKK
jgi:methyl coenzyme M reductase alpha subunit